MVAIVNAFVALLAAGAAVAVPLSTRDGACTTKTQRKAWHTLTNEEKKDYLDAELCLMAKPASLNLTATKTKFDELQAIHHGQAYNIHNVGAFLPWHRMFVHAHEVLLRTECDYEGPIVYWDETHDAGSFSTSDILDPETGFGGNGVGPDGCIGDGPFANYTSRFGPGYTINDHCIYRNVMDVVSTAASQQIIDRCLALHDILDFWPCVEAAPHAAGHGGIGGLMLDVVSSPGDPIFFLHHTWLDKIWWQWQAVDPATRLNAIGGPNKPTFGFPMPINGSFPGIPGNGTIPGFPGNGSFPGMPGMPGAGGPSGGIPSDLTDMMPPLELVDLEMAGDPSNVTTLGHVLDMFGVVPNATIADVMDTVGGLLCYEYV